MKTANRLFGILLGATVLFVSCTKQENPVRQDGNTFEMTIVAGSDQTRTVLGSDGTVTWSATGEQLAVIEQSYVGETPSVSKATSNEGYTTDEGVTMYFGVSLTAKTADSYNYYSVYPNSAYVSSSNTNVEKFKVELVSTQTPTATSFGPEADILVSKAVIGETAQPAELKLQFARVIAVGKMTIKNLNTTEKVKKVTFTAAGKPVTGRSYINLTTAAGVEYGYSNQGVDNVVLDYSGKTIAANGMTAYFTCWPFELAAGEKFSVVVETENYTFTKDITLADGKSLAFKVGHASAFNVSFSGIKGVEKAPATQLVPDGAYVVAYDKNMMTVGTTSNSYRGVATLPETANEDGSYSVDATAAWNFVYDATTDTYKISSAADNTLYLSKGSSNTALDLVSKKSATSFTITKDEVDGSIRIIYDTRCIGYNDKNVSPRFAMYLSTATDQIVDLNLYPAKFAIIPKITVQETLEVPSAGTNNELYTFPVALTNVEDVEVTVHGDADCKTTIDWIDVGISADLTELQYMVAENSGEARTAYIKIYALSSDSSEATAIVTVTQAAAGSASSKTVTYTVTSTSAVSASGDAPSGSSATYSSTYSTANQLTSGNSMTLTLSGYKGMIVKGLTLSMKSNSSKGAGYLSVKAGSESLGSIGSSSYGVNFNDASWYGKWSTSYVDVKPKLSNTAYTIHTGENLVIVIGATANSLYCESFTIEYVADPSFAGGSDPVKLATPSVKCTAKTANSLTFSWDAVANASGYQVSVDGGSTYGSTQDGTSYIWTGLSASTTKTLYVKAIGDGTNYTDSDAASAEGTTTAADANDGSLKKPFTAAEAITAIDAGGDLTNKYVKGVITEVTSFSSTYGSITYNIESGEKTLTVYGGLDLGNPQFTSLADLKVKDEVLVVGTLSKYNTSYQLDKNNYLVTLNGSSKVYAGLKVSGQKTIFTVGDEFVFDGTVIQDWRGQDDVDVTSSASFSGYDKNTAGTQTVTVTVGEESTTYEITVKSKASLAVTLGSAWNELFGTNYSGSFSTTKDALSLSGTKDNVTIAVSNGTSTNGYVKNGDFRAYNGYTITLSVPDGKKITDISTTKGGKTFTSGISANTGKGSISNNAYTWSGSSQTVVLSISGTVSFATIIVTYE